MSPLADDHLNWQALQYVLGELPKADQVVFEARLAEDLAVCEAVISASRLVLTTRAALAVREVATLLAPSCRDRAAAVSPRSSWLAVAVTSAAMAMLCLLALQVPTNSATQARFGHSSGEAELVSLWRSGMNVREDDLEDLDESLESAGDVAVPGWMLAAVSFEKPTTIDGSHDTQEN